MTESPGPRTLLAQYETLQPLWGTQSPLCQTALHPISQTKLLQARTPFRKAPEKQLLNPILLHYPLQGRQLQRSQVFATKDDSCIFW